MKIEAQYMRLTDLQAFCRSTTSMDSKTHVLFAKHFVCNDTNIQYLRQLCGLRHPSRCQTVYSYLAVFKISLRFCRTYQSTRSSTLCRSPLAIRTPSDKHSSTATPAPLSPSTLQSPRRVPPTPCRHRPSSSVSVPSASLVASPPSVLAEDAEPSIVLVVGSPSPTPKATPKMPPLTCKWQNLRWIKRLATSTPNDYSTWQSYRHSHSGDAEDAAVGMEVTKLAVHFGDSRHRCQRNAARGKTMCVFL